VLPQSVPSAGEPHRRVACGGRIGTFPTPVRFSEHEALTKKSAHGASTAIQRDRERSRSPSRIGSPVGAGGGVVHPDRARCAQAGRRSPVARRPTRGARATANARFVKALFMSTGSARAQGAAMNQDPRLRDSGRSAVEPLADDDERGHAYEAARHQHDIQQHRRLPRSLNGEAGRPCAENCSCPAACLTRPRKGNGSVF
jgi:hypothetical protein